MTIGTGMFLSSVVLAIVILYSITKDRWNWSRLVKRTGLIMLAVVMLGAATIAAYFYWDSLPSALSRQTEYAGLRLKMSPDEVTYVKGYPPFVLGEKSVDPKGPWNDFLPVIDTKKLEKGKTATDYRYWVYEVDKSTITIEFDKDRIGVVAIQCYSPDKLSRCPAVLGVKDGDSEQQAVRMLGAGEQKIQGVAKSISYPQLGVRLHLEREQVYMIQVNAPEASGLLVPTR